MESGYSVHSGKRTWCRPNSQKVGTILIVTVSVVCLLQIIWWVLTSSLNDWINHFEIVSQINHLISLPNSCGSKSNLLVKHKRHGSVLVKNPSKYSKSCTKQLFWTQPPTWVLCCRVPGKAEKSWWGLGRSCGQFADSGWQGISTSEQSSKGSTYSWSLSQPYT